MLVIFVSLFISLSFGECPPVNTNVMGICMLDPKSAWCTDDSDCGLSFDTQVQRECCPSGCNRACFTPRDTRPYVPYGDKCESLFDNAYRIYLFGAAASNPEMKQRQAQAVQEFYANNCQRYQYSYSKKQIRPTCPLKTADLTTCERALFTCDVDSECGTSHDSGKQQLCCSDGCNKRCTTPGDDRPLVPENSPCVRILADMQTGLNVGSPPTPEMEARWAKIREDAAQEFVLNACDQFQFPQRPWRPIPMAQAFAAADSTNSLDNSTQNDMPGWVVIPIILGSLILIALILIQVKLGRMLAQKN